tara:strand:- start:244 stop:627 length:384 start_codon:yes stop_codon:yes gene_type:complete
MKKFTYEDVVLSLKEIINGDEDYVYEQTPPFEWNGEPQCAYFDYKGQPSCLVGHFFAKEGLLTADSPLRRTLEGDNATQAISVMTDRGIAEFTEEATELLWYAQMHQDEGKPWGYALEGAILAGNHD